LYKILNWCKFYISVTHVHRSSFVTRNELYMKMYIISWRYYYIKKCFIIKWKTKNTPLSEKKMCLYEEEEISLPLLSTLFISLYFASSDFKLLKLSKCCSVWSWLVFRFCYSTDFTFTLLDKSYCMVKRINNKIDSD
jgi:hypothetical protein